MDALTRSMAVDLAPHGIRVNAVAPGATQSRTDKPGWKERYPQVAAGIPLGRLARPQDVGAAVAFLASDAGGYITGQVLYVDGGLTAQLTPPGIRI
jgi:NAD(P)-dependent dehydrogenase (short-subunit alcohol dehydrogenase family)